jgi:signal peptidase
VVKPEDQVALGDVITYQRSADAPPVTHRVVGVGVSVDGQLAYTTRGDANAVADAGTVRQDQVRGVVWYHVPYLGQALGGNQQHLAATAAALLIGYAAWQLRLAVRDRAARARPATSARAGDLVSSPETVVPAPRRYLPPVNVHPPAHRPVDTRSDGS